MKTIEMPTTVDERLVEMLRAVANPVRYRILQILTERGEAPTVQPSALVPLTDETFLTQNGPLLSSEFAATVRVTGPLG